MSSDGINESPRPWLLGIELRDRDPGDILAVPVADHGWAYAGDLSKLYRAWTGDRVGELDTTTLTRLDGALRAAQLRAFCGLAIRPGQAELVTVGTRMPCVMCVVTAPDPEPT